MSGATRPSPRVLLPLCLFLLTLLSYGSALRSGYVWDDHRTIERGRLIDSLRNVPALFLHDAMYNSLGEDYARRAAVDTYRPLTMTAFFVERAAFGKRPLVFHVGSLLTHALAVLLLLLVGRRLGLGEVAATLGASLFAVHPSISEAVHWINGRSDPLSVVFFLGALALWLRLLTEWASPVSPSDRRRGAWLRAAGVALLCFAATLCKETAFLLVPPLLLLLPGRAPVRRWPIALAPWALGCTLGVAARLLALGHAAASSGSAQVRHALLRLPALWLDGLRSLVFPAAEMQPSLFEAYLRVPPWRTGGAVLILAVLGGLSAWALLRGRGLPAWALSTLLLTLAPIAMLTHRPGWSGWGRYLYPAAAPFALLVGAGLTEAVSRFAPRFWDRRGAAVAALVVLILGAETFAAGASWRDEHSFALAQITDHPELSTGYANLAAEEQRRGDTTRAAALLQQAIRLAPEDNPLYHGRLSWALYRGGRQEEAYAAAHRALLGNPHDTNALYIRALELLNHGQQAAGADALLLLLMEDPAFPSIEGTVAELLRRAGPDSAFAGVLRGALADPRYGLIHPRLAGLLAGGSPGR